MEDEQLTEPTTRPEPQMTYTSESSCSAGTFLATRAAVSTKAVIFVVNMVVTMEKALPEG